MNICSGVFPGPMLIGVSQSCSPMKVYVNPPYASTRASRRSELAVSPRRFLRRVATESAMNRDRCIVFQT